ncbi:MAG: TonB-dependent receptor [Terracidiphilus sp.]|jgi:hypothetical protein
MRPRIASFLTFTASLLCIFLVCALQLNAQTETAQLSGLVTDSTGAVLPNASVLIVNRDTGVSRPVQTNAQGEYTAPALQPGHYRITVEAKGFQTLVTENVTLNVAQNANLGFQLKVGTENQTITVDGSGLQINTTDASVSTVVDQKFVANMPLNGRSFQDLISMTPGVVTQSPQSGQSIGGNGDFSVNGQRTESNYYTVDGVSANTTSGVGFGALSAANSGSVPGSTILGTTQSLISVDALREFRIESSTYSAEYGNSPGGQLSFVTRSGTNNFHGSTFDYLRNNYFDANDWFNDHYGTPIAALRQNDFGGTLGGPVRIPRLYDGRNRSFFLASYEGLLLTQPQAASLQYVPDDFMREQAPLALQPILNAFPVQNGFDYGTAAAPSLAEFTKSYSTPSRIDSTTIRLDKVITPKVSLFFRFGDTPSYTDTRLLSTVTKFSSNTQTYTLGSSIQITNAVASETRIGYSRNDATTAASMDNFGGASPVNLADLTGVGSYANPAPTFLMEFSGIGLSALSLTAGGNKSRQWNIVETVSMLSGHHQLKFGLNYRRIKGISIDPGVVAEGVFSSPDSVLNNSMDELYIAKYVNVSPIFNDIALFAQDEWKLTPKVVLSLGLRWEVNPPPTDAHGNDAYTLLGSIYDPSSLTLAPQGTPLWKTSWYNFAPRLGVAWVARTRAGWETVIRTGGGVFYDTNNQQAAQAFNGVGSFAYQLYFGVPFPITSEQLEFSPSATPPYTSSTAYAFPTHLQAPYTLQWNVSLEQAIARNQTVTLSYVGANGRRLSGEQELSLASLNPNFGTVVYLQGGLTSNYQALQAKFQRTLSHGLQGIASYTWSHAIDFGSDYEALPFTRGNADFDLRQNLSGGLSWDLPTVAGSQVKGMLLNGWGLDGRVSARTGFPITLQGNLIVDPATGNTYYGNVDLLSGEQIYLHGSQYPGGRALNPAAFQLPSNPDNPGTAPRNFARGFGAAQVNLAARREFHLHDQLALQFRAETFNILNHPNFGYVDPYLTDVLFGQATKMLNQSLGTVAPQYQQGGPRSMQFALKFLF